MLMLAAPSSAPSTPDVHNYTTQSISLTWGVPLEEDLNGALRQFVVHVFEHETGRAWNETSNDKNHTLDNLHPYYTYDISVAAETVSVGPFSMNITVQLAEEGT